MAASTPFLQNGDRLSRQEFERRYETMPHIKKAELIEEVVFIQERTGVKDYGHPCAETGAWLGVYSASAPCLLVARNATVRLDLNNEVQPDFSLCIPSNLGGQSDVDADDFIANAPELITEVVASCTTYILQDKLEVYRRNGVKECFIWQTQSRKLDWLVFSEGQYYSLASDNGIYKSPGFPGLWLDTAALLESNLAKVLETLQQGIASKEHEAFVTALSERVAA
jgi:Putative restriction endonuclease